MVPEILHHIERLQSALADADPRGNLGAAAAVAAIAAELRQLDGAGDDRDTADFPRMN